MRCGADRGWPWGQQCLWLPPCLRSQLPSGHRLTGVLSPSLQIEDFRAAMAQRLVRLLQICAGHVPGVSALNLLSLMRGSENPSLEDL